MARSKGGESLLRKAREAMDAREWDAAQDYAQRVLVGDPDDVEAHMLAFLSGRHIASVDDLQAVAAQIVSVVPAVATPLAEVLAAEEGTDDDAEPSPAPHADVAALLAQNPGVHAPYDSKLDGLHQAKDAFDAVFGDPDWAFALEHAYTDDNRRMVRAREAAEEVFSAAFAEEKAHLDAACQAAKGRVPQTVELMADARKACDAARAELEERSGARKSAVSDHYSFLHRNIRTAHAGLRVGVVLIVLGLVLLVLTLVPSTGTITNPLASFAQVSVPISLVVVVVGIGLLMARSGLVRDNQDHMAERVKAGSDAKDQIQREVDELGTRVAAVESCINSLEWAGLEGDGFGRARGDLSQAVARLAGGEDEGAAPEDARQGSAEPEAVESEAAEPAGSAIDDAPAEVTADAEDKPADPS